MIAFVFSHANLIVTFWRNSLRVLISFFPSLRENYLNDTVVKDYCKARIISINYY